MSVTLAQAAIASQNELQRGIVETFLLESSFLDRVPFLEIQGNAYAYNSEATLPGVEFRAVNAGYTESTGTVNQSTEKLVILGGESDVDTFIQKTRSNVNDQRAIQDALKVKAITYKWQDAFINGDTAVDANSFDGLKKRITGGQVITAAANGLAIIGGGTNAEIFTFLDMLDQLCQAVPGLSGGNGCLIMNALVRTRILSALRRVNVQVESVGRLPEPIQQGVATGAQVNEAQIPTYNGVPMINAGTTAAGTLILPQTETMGSSNITSSIYAVRFGQNEADGGVTGLTNGMVDVRDLGEAQASPVLKTRIEFFTGLAVFSGTGAARLKGVLNS